MMGTSHAVSGAAAWLAVSAVSVPSLDLFDVAPALVLLGAPVAAGAALLPDADHHNATIAHSVPVAGRVAAGVIGGVTGGHRKGMHSLLAVAAVIFGMTILSALTWSPEGRPFTFHLGAAIAVLACVTFAAKSLKLVRSWPLAWIVGIIVGVLVGVMAPEHTAWLPWCIGTGYLAHLLGDMLTTGGVPLLWPLPIKPPRAVSKVPLLNRLWLPGGGVAVPVLGDTGSWREQGLFLALTVYVLWGVCSEAILALQMAR